MYCISEDAMKQVMNGNTKLMLMVLQHHAKDSVCDMTVSRLGEVIGITRITANSCLQELQDKGLIRIALDEGSKMKKYKYEVLV